MKNKYFNFYMQKKSIIKEDIIKKKQKYFHKKR